MSRLKIVIDLQYPWGRSGVPAPVRVRAWVEAVLAAEQRDGAVSLRFVDEAESESYNSQYRQRQKPTNVLSFPALTPPGLPPEAGAPPLGDLLICVPVVQREAQEQGKAVIDHFAHMVVHGLLHLLGYDHIDAEQARLMEARERSLLAVWGIADPYTIGAATPSSATL
ncbi:MAG: rRNA maturation RNase YbeY [Wenzhouxiangellaceae bacterium]